MSKIDLDLSLSPKCFQIPQIEKDIVIEAERQIRIIQSQNWRQKNKIAVSKYYQNKRKTNFQFALYDRYLGILRGVIYKFQKQKSMNKTNIMGLNFNQKQLIKHLEALFDCSMNWSNYGKYWAIDHKIPNHKFKYSTINDQDFKDCFALSNLQPLSKTDNRKKWHN